MFPLITKMLGVNTSGYLGIVGIDAVGLEPQG
jgi:hypothetical protein